MILATWLALTSANYYQIAPFHALNRILFLANETASLKRNSQSNFEACLKKSVQLQKNEGHATFASFYKPAQYTGSIKYLCWIKILVNFVPWNLVWNHTCNLKSNLHCALVWLWNYAYNFGPNGTPLSSIIIMNWMHW